MAVRNMASTKDVSKLFQLRGLGFEVSMVKFEWLAICARLFTRIQVLNGSPNHQEADPGL